jgi:phytanoyl-CoA hydroxylase
MNLSEYQRKQFEKNGYIVIHQCLSAYQIKLITSEIETNCKSWESNQKIRIINDVVYFSSHLLESTTRGPLMGIAESVFDIPVEIQHSKLLDKPFINGRSARIKPHQDFAFFPHTNYDLFALMIPLDGMSTRSGALRVWPGSHKLELLSHLDKDGRFQSQISDDSSLADLEATNIEMQAGDLLIFHSLLAHWSPEKEIDTPRRNIYIQYRAADAAQLAGPIWRCTGLGRPDRKRPGKVRFPNGLEIETRGQNGRLYDLYGSLAPDGGAGNIYD